MEKEKGTEIRELSPTEILLSWEAPEFVHHVRDIKWYLLAFLVVFSLLGYSIYSKDWFFILVLVLVIFGVSSYLKTAPKIRKYAVTRLGIFIDKNFFSYDELNSFWIIFNEKIKILNILPNKKYIPPLTILLEDQDPMTIKNILKKFILQEEKRSENFFEKMTRLLKL